MLEYLKGFTSICNPSVVSALYVCSKTAIVSIAPSTLAIPVIASSHLGHGDETSMSSPWVAPCIATNKTSTSLETNSLTFLTLGTQLDTNCVIASPLSKASGFFIISSSLAVIGKIGNSPVSGYSKTSSL